MSQTVTFCNYLHEVNSKFHGNHQYGGKALCYKCFFSYYMYLMKQCFFETAFFRETHKHSVLRLCSTDQKIVLLESCQ